MATDVAGGAGGTEGATVPSGDSPTDVAVDAAAAAATTPEQATARAAEAVNTADAAASGGGASGGDVGGRGDEEVPPADTAESAAEAGEKPAEEAESPGAAAAREDREAEAQEEQRRKQEEEDAAMAAAMEQSLNQTEVRDRPGEALTLPRLAELGLAFERQPDGSDSCAIHSLNNLTQPVLSPEAVPDLIAARVAAAVAQEWAEEVERFEGCDMHANFSLRDLQEAEEESRREEANDSFLPAATSSLINLRTNSGPVGLEPRSPQARTGMFEVEAVKVAARNKGFEVIDVEPTPSWEDPGCGVAQYAQAAMESAAKGGDRWLLGFLVYERIPGRAMHYYVVVRRPAEKISGKLEPEAWLVLDGLDRGPHSPRNRIMTFEEMKAFYNRNGEWFRSWLVRWYPVVDRSAAINTLCRTCAQAISDACGEKGIDSGLLGISPQRAEVALESSGVRWDVTRAAKTLVEAVALVDRELLVLQLAVSEKQARSDLEETGWSLERAVQRHAERMRGVCNNGFGAAVGASDKYAALFLGDWDARAAAQTLIVAARPPTAGVAGAAAMGRAEALKAAAAALEACGWDMDRAYGVLGLMQRRAAAAEGAEAGKASEALSEGYCAKVLEHVRGDLVLAERLLDVHRRFAAAPPAVCAEALRRGDGNAVAACSLLEEFRGRLQQLVEKAWSTQEDAPHGDVRLAGEVAQTALEVAEWNPPVAFMLAETFALALVQVQREWRMLEAKMRSSATAVVECSDLGGGAGPPASEKDIAAALAVIDILDSLRRQAIASTHELLSALQEASLEPTVAARRLWQTKLESLGVPAQAVDIASVAFTRAASRKSNTSQHSGASSLAPAPAPRREDRTPSPRPKSGDKGKSAASAAPEAKGGKQKAGKKKPARSEDCRLM